MPITSHMNRSASKPDLSSISGRTAVGLNDTVKQSFKYIRSPDSNIGLLGFEFTHFGRQYQVRYKDDSGNDKYTYELTLAKVLPYSNNTNVMGIAEKAHALMMVMQIMDANIAQQNLYHLNKLEQACFDANSGTVKRGLVGISQTAQSAKIVSHYGLDFPEDADYKREPEMRVMAMEWVSGLQYKLIDNSNVIADFIVTNAYSRTIGRMHMSHEDARSAIEYAKETARQGDHVLAAMAARTNLWRKLEHSLLYVSLYQTPAGP